MTRNTGKRYGSDVKDKILNKALKMWEQDHNNLTVMGVAKALGMNHANIYHHFPEGLKDAVAEHAVQTKNTRIVARLIALGHPATDQLCPTERAEYLSNLNK
jgi:AcrR family transcriptional regulator